MSTFNAIMGGAFAALGSVSAKLVVDQHTEQIVALIGQIVPTSTPTSWVPWLARTGMAGCIGLCNFLMWLFFTRALSQGQSTPQVVMVQTISNFVVTAVCGVYLFGDVLSTQWWTGASLVACGLVLLTKMPEKQKKS